MKPLKAEPDRLRANFVGAPDGVDRENKVIRGMILAQEGPFKSAGRGEFDAEALRQIVRMTNAKPKGLRSNFAHESLSSDGLGKHLGRVKNARLGTARVERDGKTVSVAAARGDLHFDESAFNTPSGDLASSVMNLAESDPDAVSSSLVIDPKMVTRLDDRGYPLTDDDGNELPPLWYPVRLFNSDIVSVGDAVDGLLSAGVDVDSLPDFAVRRGSEMLDKVFAGQSREVVEARCRAWLDRYLNTRFGEPKAAPATPHLDARRQRVLDMASALRRT
jgi:hypothetical protein